MAGWDAIAAAKDATTLELLFRVARQLDDRAIARVNALAGRVVARRATLELIPHLGPGGTRIQALADALGISKQAVSKRVAELAAEGLVEVGPDPADARARRVTVTPFGEAAILHGLGVLRDLEAELVAAVGPGPLAELRRALEALAPVAGGPPR